MHPSWSAVLQLRDNKLTDYSFVYEEIHCALPTDYTPKVQDIFCPARWRALREVERSVYHKNNRFGVSKAPTTSHRRQSRGHASQPSCYRKCKFCWVKSPSSLIVCFRVNYSWNSSPRTYKYDHKYLTLTVLHTAKLWKAFSTLLLTLERFTVFVYTRITCTRSRLPGPTVQQW